jgi:putative ABC transport system ATP-binding protein
MTQDPVFDAAVIPGPVLQLHDVSKVYGHGDTAVTAVSHASTAVYPGQMVALLGPSGSGKSTLLLMAGLLEAPTSGNILLHGRPANGPGAAIADARAFRRQHIGFVFQKPNLIPFLSAAENVQLAQEINDMPAAQARHRTHELLSYLEVEHRRDNRPSQLSGGEQQRVAIARAMANRPLLLLADEPTAALDSKRGRQVMSLFKQVARDLSAAVLVVTHDHRSLDLFDRILQMDDGHLSECTPSTSTPTPV